MRPVAHLDLDAFFASASVLRRPDLAARPLVVANTGPHSVVATASYEARRFGVHSAMPLGEARRRCPGLVVVAPDFAWYRTLSLEVLRVIADFADEVQPLSLDEAFFVAGPRTDDEMEDLIRRLRVAVYAETGLRASVGAGPTRTVAKMASDAAKPDGQLVVPAERAREWLARQELSAVPGVGPSTRDTLADAGVLSVAQLASLSPHELPARLGSHGRDLWRRVRAEDVLDGPLVTPEPTHSIGSEETLDSPARTLEEFRRAVRAQARVAADRLARAGLSTRGLTLKVRTTLFEDRTRSAALGLATNDEWVIATQLERLIAATWAELHSPVRLVGVTFTGLGTVVQLRLPLDAHPARQWDVVRSPHAGEWVEHSVFGHGRVVVYEPDVAVVRFADRARIIREPRKHLILSEIVRKMLAPPGDNSTTSQQ